MTEAEALAIYAEAKAIFAEAKAGALAAWQHRPVNWPLIRAAHEEYTVALVNMDEVYDSLLLQVDR